MQRPAGPANRSIESVSLAEATRELSCPSGGDGGGESEEEPTCASCSRLSAGLLLIQQLAEQGSLIVVVDCLFNYEQPELTNPKDKTMSRLGSTFSKLCVVQSFSLLSLHCWRPAQAYLVKPLNTFASICSAGRLKFNKWPFCCLASRLCPSLCR